MVVDLELDLRYADGYSGTSPADMLMVCLQQAGIYSEALLYRAVCGSEKNSTLRQFWTDYPDLDTIMALSHEEVFINPADPTLFKYAEDGEYPVVIAVYDRRKFRDDPHDAATYIYGFLNPKQKPDALVAIINVQWQ